MTPVAIENQVGDGVPLVLMTRVVMMVFITMVVMKMMFITRVVMVASYTCIILRLHSRETEAKTRLNFFNNFFNADFFNMKKSAQIIYLIGKSLQR